MKHFCLLPIVCLLLSCSPLAPIGNPFDDLSETGAEVAGGTLKIIVIDVGQGDATLVIGPAGQTLLIDGGPPGAGTSIILPMIDSLGLDDIDWFVASHYDSDHIGGLPEIPPPTLGWIDRGDRTDKTTPVLEQYLRAAPFRTEASPGMHIDLGRGAVAEVVVVNGRYADGEVVHLNPDEENEASIGLLVEYNGFRYFTAGDLPGGGSPGGYESKDLETIAAKIIGDIDVLHVSHHGSSSGTGKDFLETTRPEAAIISVGADNDYHHPTEVILKRLEEIGAGVYRTDRMGSIEIATDAEGYSINPFP